MDTTNSYYSITQIDEVAKVRVFPWITGFLDFFHDLVFKLYYANKYEKFLI
jgi:hypothetical protein